MTSNSYKPEHVRPIERNLAPEGRYTPHNLERMRHLVKHERRPPEGEKVNTIIVLGTSKLTDYESYLKRIVETLKYANRYPSATIIVSGMRPDVSRATAAELASGFSEASVMRDTMVELGLNPNRIVLEEEAKHTKENVEKSLDLLLDTALPEDPQGGVLFICSSYMGRRTDLYLRKTLEARKRTELKTYIADADLTEEHERGDAFRESARQEACILYEALRLSKYRRLGDL